MALPPVAPGKVRVFRGQTADYPTITPASYRKHLGSRGIWTIYSRFLLTEIQEDLAGPHLASEELQIQCLWLAALAQHYGSGSSYLDVTHSIESAAWFGLHCGEPVTESALLDSAGPSRMSVHTRDVEWLAYSRAVEPGYLYAFDVDVWDQSAITPPDLALVDLSNAPEPFKTPRMLAQLGCLIETGESDHYDLRCRRVKGTPLPIAWPMTGSEFVKRTVEEMFPAPAVDPWYRRFLSVPMIPDVNAATGEIMLRRPLPVTLYRGETPAYNSALTATEWFVDPPLLHHALQHLQVKADASKDEYLQEVVMSGATPVVLEAPLLYIFPSPGSDLWNHELLFSDLCDTVATYSNAIQEGGDVSLLNVLFQFSQLEETFWERAGASHETHRLTRGVWLARQQECLVAALLVQDFPGTALDTQPPVTIRLDPVKRRMIYKLVEGETEWAELSTVPELAKPVFVALYLLRSLNPRVKIEATPLRWITTPEQHDGAYNKTYFASFFADAARLVRVQGRAGVADWFFLRNAQNDPFTTATKTSPYLKIDTAAAFADLRAGALHDRIAAAMSGPGQA